MGVTVLHAYPVPTDKTAPQVINCKFGTFIALPATGIFAANRNGQIYQMNHFSHLRWWS
jgi:hypothetical protein